MGGQRGKVARVELQDMEEAERYHAVRRSVVSLIILCDEGHIGFCPSPSGMRRTKPSLPAFAGADTEDGAD